jgi:hypothetical protein
VGKIVRKLQRPEEGGECNKNGRLCTGRLMLSDLSRLSELSVDKDTGKSWSRESCLR